MSTQQTWVRALSLTQTALASGRSLPALLPELAEDHRNRLALVEAGNYVTYQQLFERTNRYANWALAQGLAGQVVCLLLPNQIDYVALWLALTRIGCTVALLNTNLSDSALNHCIQAAGATDLITDRYLSNPPVGMLWDWPSTKLRAETCSAEPLALAFPKLHDRALLIYTSGTTGLPKATNITHRRIVEWSYWFAGMMNVQSHDRLYDCLPMYHSIGGIVAVGSMLVKGGSVVVRDKFSASRFWDDVVAYECTIFQYIGELCRYLVATPPHPLEHAHCLRLACGNGLQGSVWQPFKERFGILEILEFYAATEGNLSLYNIEGKPGAIGRIPAFLGHWFRATIIRYDPDTASPIRNIDGFCIPCDVGEPGEAISLIDQTRKFDGYTDRAASERKLLRDVFVNGDCWFRSGDLMQRDAAGYWYFLDRLGDTYRWKGENVSTTEVASVLCSIPGVTDAVVYGVTVPGAEGKAGMAAICIDSSFNISAFNRHVGRQLPEYARPLFVRVCPALPLTGTFKLNKTALVSEGYQNVIDDLVWSRNTKGDYLLLEEGVGV